MIAELKFIRAFISPIGFIIMGIYLVQKVDKMAILVGYVNIFFWAALLQFAIYKLATKKINLSEPRINLCVLCG